ncbi:Anaphase-promoting complex subunit 15 [Chamberlinius hualienensis]
MNGNTFSWKFPVLLPRIVDPLWFSADKPCDHENELVKMEEEHQKHLTSIAQKGSDIIPIGKTASEALIPAFLGTGKNSVKEEFIEFKGHLKLQSLLLLRIKPKAVQHC